MGRSHQDPQGHLTALCPRCGNTVRAATLGALKRRIQGCCRSAPVVTKRHKPPLLTSPPPTVPLDFVLGRMISSQNKTTYSHWHVHHSDKKAWLRIVRRELEAVRGLYLPWSVWHIQRVYQHPKREMDFANLVGGAKPLIDCLSDEGVIVDDAPQYFTCSYEQRRGDGNYTILTLLRYTSHAPSNLR